MERGPAREAAVSAQQAQSAGAVPASSPQPEGSARARKTADSRVLVVPGLEFPRYFTLPGVDPFDEVEWEIRSAVIGNEKGKVVFEQRDVEIPKFWSQQATNIVVSKYFRGQMGSPDREHSVKQLIGRVVDTITGWAREQKVTSPVRTPCGRSPRNSSTCWCTRRPRSTVPCGSTVDSRRRRSAQPVSSTLCRTRWTRS